MRIIELVEFSPYYYKLYGVKVALNWYNKLWWRLMPGTVVKVKWPVGDVIITEDHSLWDWSIGPSKYIVESADPNDHYRPWMEQNVGKQGLDWDWSMLDNDVSQNTLTIKFRKGKEHWATLAALRWS